MNTCWYLMLVYLLSITFLECGGLNQQNDSDSPDRNIIPAASSTGKIEGNQSSMNVNNAELERQQSSSQVNGMQQLSAFYNRAKSIGKTLLDSKAGKLAKNLSLKYAKSLLPQGLQDLTINGRFVKAPDLCQFIIESRSTIFGARQFKLTAEHARIDETNPPITGENKSDQRVYERTVAAPDPNENYPMNPMLPFWENVLPITTEVEFKRNASFNRFFPYHVVLIESTGETLKWCQGGLIKPNWIITSKTCLREKFDSNTEKPVDVFLDAMDQENDESIFYSNVVLKDSVKVGPIMFEEDLFGFDDLALVKLVTVSKIKEVSPVALEIPASDTAEEGYCYFVSRCSDGVVRSVYYEMAHMATQSDLKFLEPGALLVCDNQLFNIKTTRHSFYPLISALNWIEKTIEEGNSYYNADSFDLNGSCDRLSGRHHFEYTAAQEKCTNVPFVKGNESFKKKGNKIVLNTENVKPITTVTEFMDRASNAQLFPFHAVIMTSAEETLKLCQGALIGSNWIITPKSCLKKHFDVETEIPVSVFLDAINANNSDSIFYANVVLKDYITDDPIMFQGGIFGFEDLALMKLVNVSNTTEVAPIGLEIFLDHIPEKNDCYIVTRCSDGVVRGLLYTMTSKMDLGYLQLGTLIVCDNQLLSIKTSPKKFYSFTSPMVWIENSLQEVKRLPKLTNVKT